MQTARKKRLTLMTGMLLAALARPDAIAENDNTAILETVLVTANKREEDLRTIAGSVSAFTGDQLAELGAQSLGDYVASLPGVHFNNYQAGVSHVVIRGVSTTTYHENSQTVVGYHLNDIPLSEAGFPIAIPDIDTFDLERVEVLRGPQGTLYGAGSLGGSVNYITKQADSLDFDAAIESSIGNTDGASEQNYTLKGMINVPIIEDTLALRITTGRRFVAGHLDNLILQEDGSNDLTIDTARASIVYTPTDKATLTWTSLYQETDTEDQTYAFTPGFVRFGSRFPEYQTTEVELHSLRLDYEFDTFTATVIGAMAKKESDLAFDFGQVGILPTPFAQDRSIADADIEHFEARIASSDDGRLTWLIGTSYSTSERHNVDGVYQKGVAAYVDANPNLFGGNPGSLLTPNDFVSRGNIFDQTNDDFAVFGQLTYDITDDLALTLGGRYFDSENSLLSSVGASVTAPNVFDAVGSSLPKAEFSETGFTPKVTVKYQITEDVMLYSSYAEGFRVGGANPNPVSLTGVPGSESYDSDSTRNYEFGIRTDLLDGRAQIDATLFQIDWDDIQVRLFTPAPLFLAYTVNASGAENKGVEVSGSWRVNDALQLHANVTYLDAQIAKSGGGFTKGATLPGSSDWSTSARITYTIDAIRFTPRLSLTHRYASKAPEAFVDNAVKSQGFHMVDFRTELMLNDNVTISLFIDNLLDEYGVLSSPFGHFFSAPVASLVRPRTTGIKLNWEY